MTPGLDLIYCVFLCSLLGEENIVYFMFIKELCKIGEVFSIQVHPLEMAYSANENYILCVILTSETILPCIIETKQLCFLVQYRLFYLIYVGGYSYI
jgi:hypothetical protein